MSEKTQAQLISELSAKVAEVVATSAAWADYGQRDISRLDVSHTRMNDTVHDLSNRIVVLEHKIDELRSGRLEWARRLWGILGPLIGEYLSPASSTILAGRSERHQCRF